MQVYTEAYTIITILLSIQNKQFEALKLRSPTRRFL